MVYVATMLSALSLCAIVLVIFRLSRLSEILDGFKKDEISDDAVRKIESAVRQAVTDGMKSNLDAQVVRQDAADKLLEMSMRQVQKSVTDSLEATSQHQVERLGQIEKFVTVSVDALSKSEVDGREAMSRLITEKLDGLGTRLSDSMGTLEKSTNGAIRELSERSVKSQEQSDALVRERLDSMVDQMSKNQEKSDTAMRERLDLMSSQLADSQQKSGAMIDTAIQNLQKASDTGTQALKETVRDSLKATDSVVKAELGAMAETMNNGLKAVSARQAQAQEKSDAMLQERLAGVEKSVAGMSGTVNEQLNLIRKTVDDELSEHLEKRLSDSFAQVTSQLESVYKGLGEMQTLAQGVGDLKKVLSNTKTRGILGEAQLKAIISDVLAPEQYDENVATVKNSSERVEFAVKLPVEGGKFTYLPIDAKFPGDTYAALQDAYATGDKGIVEKAAKALCDRLRAEAKDIRDKYIHEPETTGFGVMFLPFEGLYAEAVNRGMVEDLSRNFRVNIAGPSTMAALLCSLQMSFRTIAIQKRSQEVWDVLSAVQTEFNKFGDALDKVEAKMNSAVGDLGTLKTTRVNAMRRRLRGVQEMADDTAQGILGIVSDVQALPESNIVSVSQVTVDSVKVEQDDSHSILKAGQKLMHKTFGAGVVTDVLDNRFTVQFEKDGKKQFMTSALADGKLFTTA